MPPTPSTIGEVIEQMEAILDPLGPNDGVACFTRLYLEVTEGVQARLQGLVFADPAFVADLDVRFANLYFTALEIASESGPVKVPPAWAPLFEARSRRGIAPLQFAIAGMNAHINRDLPIALVASWQNAGVSPDGSPQHADYLRINQLLASVESEVKDEYLGGWLHRIDRILHRVHRLDDVVAMWDISRARDAAWTNAEALWALRTNEPLADRYISTLDRSVGLASRGLLTPADTWVGRVGRFFHIGGPVA